MVIANLEAWLSGAEGAAMPSALRPRQAAAGLILAAAQREGRVTPIERDRAIAALMKLLHVGNPEAKEIIADAEDILKDGQHGFASVANAARDLPRDEQEALMTHLWRLVPKRDEAVADLFMASVGDALGFTPAQADALRVVVA